MFAVVELKGNQYKLEPDKEYKIDLMSETEDKTFKFTEVLLVSDDKKVTVGTPTVKGAEVEVELLGLTRGKKVEGIKFRPKKHYQRNLGHKQNYTLIKVLSIKQ